jgi:hypothetical protein
MTRLGRVGGGMRVRRGAAEDAYFPTPRGRAALQKAGRPGPRPPLPEDPQWVPAQAHDAANAHEGVHSTVDGPLVAKTQRR